MSDLFGGGTNVNQPSFQGVADGSLSGNASATEAAIEEAFALIMAEQLLSEPLVSTSQSIARRLPGSPENVNGQMQAMREEDQLVSERRELARKMAKIDDQMNYRD